MNSSVERVLWQSMQAAKKLLQPSTTFGTLANGDAKMVGLMVERLHGGLTHSEVRFLRHRTGLLPSHCQGWSSDAKHAILIKSAKIAPCCTNHSTLICEWDVVWWNLCFRLETHSIPILTWQPSELLPAEQVKCSYLSRSCAV